MTEQQKKLKEWREQAEWFVYVTSEKTKSEVSDMTNIALKKRIDKILYHAKLTDSMYREYLTTKPE